MKYTGNMREMCGNYTEKCAGAGNAQNLRNICATDAQHVQNTMRHAGKCEQMKKKCAGAGNTQNMHNICGTHATSLKNMKNTNMHNICGNKSKCGKNTKNM
jgi:hypothetical protein